MSGAVLAEIAPVLLLAPLAGRLVDRLPRVQVIVAAELVRVLLAVRHDSAPLADAVACGLSSGQVFLSHAARSPPKSGARTSSSPYVERLRGNHALSAALTGTTAAAVGVLAHLAVYFALHTLFARNSTLTGAPLRLELPQPASLRHVAINIALHAAVLLSRQQWSVLRTLGAWAGVGVIAGLLGLATG